MAVLIAGLIILVVGFIPFTKTVTVTEEKVKEVVEKFSADSMFLRLMYFRRGEGLPLDEMYVRLRIVEDKEKEKVKKSKYYDEESYYGIKEKMEGLKEFYRIKVKILEKSTFWIPLLEK